MTRASRLRRRIQPVALRILVVVLGAAPGAAQTGSAGQTSREATPATPAPPPQGYSYNPAGRRDPFVPLVQRGADSRGAVINRPEGLPGVAVSEVAIKGIVQSRGAFVAMLQAPDNKTYIVRNGDRLFDATVKAVTADAVVFVQQVSDPLSLVKQREIRRPLRPIEEGK
jgi:type IV pilus assembly protein PilP